MTTSQSHLLSISSYSTIGTRQGRIPPKTFTIFRFSSRWEYVIITMGCSFTYHSLKGFVNIQNTEQNATLIHYILCYLFVGLPLNYFQILMGQYSQLGTIFFKHMSPVGHGVGYAFLLNSFAWCCQYGMLLADFLMYFLACVELSLNWMVCPSNSSEVCWDFNSNCTTECINENISTSSYFYWKKSYMHDPNFYPKHLTMGKPLFVRVVPLCICWSLIFTLVSMGINRYKEIIRMNFYIIITFLLILLMVSFVTVGSGNGIKLLFRVNPNSFFTITAWSSAIHDTLQLLALCRICHVTYGSYMTPAMPSDILTIFSVFLNFIFTILATTILQVSMGITMHEAHVGSDNVKHIWRNGVSSYFTVTPQGIVFMGVPQLWFLMYFIICILIVTNNLITQIDNIERSISDAHSRFRVYRDYMLAAICILGTIIGIMLSSPEAFVISHRLYYKVMEQVHLFGMLVMSFLAFWIYRVQRICDDVHFLHGSQPTKFWKIMWYTMPLIIGVPYLYLTCFDKSRKTVAPYVAMHFMSYFFLISPIPIFMIYEVFRYLKIHNLVSILQPEERWGPPDPQERHLRHLFNPRQEIRSRRRDDTCQHNCLIGSRHIKKIMAEEIEQRRLYLNSLEEESPYCSSRNSISSWISNYSEYINDDESI